MSERDAALLARSAAALRAEGKVAEADQLDAVVARIRREDEVEAADRAAAGATPTADLSGVRTGTFRVRDVEEPPVPRPPRRRPGDDDTP